MNTITILLLPLLWYPVVYLLGAFVWWNLNAGAWREMDRGLVIAMATLLAFCTWGLLVDMLKAREQ